MSKLEFHYTPKHASWLKMVEIEIGVLRTMCLDRRIEQRSELADQLRNQGSPGCRLNRS